MEPLFLPKTISLYQRAGYSLSQIQADIFSGIIVGILALPLAIAFAIASGVSPEKGIVTAIVAGFLISFLGGSRVQIGGPTGAFVVIVVSIVQVYGIQGLIISTILAGVILIFFGLLRLGTLIKFIPLPLVVGFTSGIAVIIFTSQINDFLGLGISTLPSEFTAKWVAYFDNIDKTNMYSVGIALSTIIISVYSKRFMKKIPGAFISIILMTLIVTFFKLPVQTIESVFGVITAKISFVDFSSFSFEGITRYIQPAITIAMLGAIESLLSAVVSDGMISSTHRSNTELIAQGFANIASGLFGGIPATGAIARTATNVKNGARTPISGMVHALTLLLILLFFGKFAAMIPLACLAGILIVVAYNMSEWRSFISITRGSKYDVLVLIVTFFLTVFADLTIAIEVGMVLSALLFMQRMSKLSEISSLEADFDNMEEYASLPKGISVYEINGPFFFGAANKYKEVLKEVGIRSKVMVLRMRNVPFIDATGMHNFKEVLKTLKNYKVRIVLSGVQPNVREELLKSGIDRYIPLDMICPHYDIAKVKAVEILGDMEKHAGK
ncbi:MAG: sodium-independent anion transporter [Bacteroidetes bacterium GWE2_41_25]|nr:MAG: sodium-independent anion transporter [Bacteroidetes bacterium GWA2_40_15]OFX99679.1 MAG: sodium-independent anion transporter [Bacteroidetes bacterium GWC2_40_22]OFY12247.1 MAG: sodium-independent anion transporter [Bacteroidetes bacterium GWE2_41_25]OFY60678.1 MAG: sodium-independent anion transporter [Bacteroidetes bacterium GWF2_41_9]HAM11511.1 sodium-independent anion transporter [Bacteroidales bacterium]